ncbi:MAG: hypothetical protein SOZ66_01500 [Candidatus Cryptobacteroides sp.]|nr:hypothetical protein [Candidatus Cryptobacteroides sp.]
MKRTSNLLFGLLSLLLTSLPLSLTAQEERYSSGLYNSPRGFGIVVQKNDFSDYSFNSFLLCADTYGVLTGRSRFPGVKFNFSRNFRMITFRGENCMFDLFAGTGVSGGFVRDFEKGSFIHKEALNMNFGVIAASSFTTGCHFRFSRRLDLELSWMLELGMHIRKDEYHNGTLLSLYSNGLIRTWYPQLIILYKW